MDPRRWHGIEKMRQKAGSWHREDETEDLSWETLKTEGWKLKYETVSLCKFRYKCVAFVDGKSTIGDRSKVRGQRADEQLLPDLHRECEQLYTQEGH